jgi:predicted aspartyl protease
MPRFQFTPNSVFYVWTSLNGIRQRLIFDTGSQWIALLQNVIDRLGLQPTNRTTEPVTADSRVVGIRRPIYTIPTVEAFGLTAHDIEAVAIDLPPNCGFVGTLGVSFLKHFVFTVNFKEGWIEIN